MSSAIRIEAEDSHGAPVSWPMNASGFAEQDLPIICTPANGATYPIGVTNVSCEATDSKGASAVANVSVTVFDAPPYLVFPASPLVVSANRPEGALGTFFANAHDRIDGQILPTCVPATGSLFPLGITRVSCEAVDTAGNHVRGAFDLKVVDDLPPEFQVPPDIIIGATSREGAIATYSPVARDIVDGVVNVSCFPISGSIFHIGTTSIRCDASDAAGNAANASFAVRVVDTAPTIENVSDLTRAVETDGAFVNYSLPATSDAVDGPGISMCAPASGARFPMGSTRIVCTATDSAGPWLETQRDVR